jgi:glycosyltransferase involved in cell wall biosynthesis
MSEFISVLISSYNTKIEFVVDCLESIQLQRNLVPKIEVVWINDGSDINNTEELVKVFKKNIT